MSAEERARFTIQSLLARGLGAGEVARRTGLERASEVWGGDRPRDRPAWYLWLAGSPGAYQLGLEDAVALSGGAWHARYTVRYYPSPAEVAFPGFSVEERGVVQGGLLDATGTPRIESAASIPETSFVVGGLEWAATGDGEAAAVGLSTLDQLVARDEAGTLLRDVPGWRLAAPLLSTLAGLYAQLERRALRRAVVARQPGFELVGTAAPAWQDTGEVVHGEAWLLLDRPGDVPASATGAELLETLLDPEAEVVADEGFQGACRHPARLEAEGRLPLRVLHAWFGGDAVPEDRIGCAC